MQLQQRSTSCAQCTPHPARPRRGGPVRSTGKENVDNILGGQGRLTNAGFQEPLAVALAKEFPSWPEVLKLGKDVEEINTNMVTKTVFKDAIAGLATKHDLAIAVTMATAGLATKDEMSTMVTTAVAGLATKQDVATAVTTAVAGLATKEDLTTAVTTAVTGLVTREEVAKLASKEEAAKLASKEEVAKLASKEEVAKLASKEEVVKAQAENSQLSMKFYMLLTAVASAATMYAMIALKIVKAG